MDTIFNLCEKNYKGKKNITKDRNLSGKLPIVSLKVKNIPILIRIRITMEQKQ